MRVATFNLKHGATASGYVGDPAQVAAACAALDADILALQEVDRRVWRSRFADLVRRAAGTDYTGVYFAPTMRSTVLAGINPVGQYGNALLVKGRISEAITVALPHDYLRLRLGRRELDVVREPRNAIVARVIVAGCDVAVAATHLGGPERRRQLAQVVTALCARTQPRILLGDFNTTRVDLRAWLGPTPLTLADSPSARHPCAEDVDFIATDAADGGSLVSRWFPISDHAAVIADLRPAAMS